MTLLPPFIFCFSSLLKPKSQTTVHTIHHPGGGARGRFFPSPSCVVGETMGGRLISTVSALAVLRASPWCVTHPLLSSICMVVESGPCSPKCNSQVHLNPYQEKNHWFFNQLCFYRRKIKQSSIVKKLQQCRTNAGWQSSAVLAIKEIVTGWQKKIVAGAKLDRFSHSGRFLLLSSIKSYFVFTSSQQINTFHWAFRCSKHLSCHWWGARWNLHSSTLFCTHPVNSL